MATFFSGGTIWCSAGCMATSVRIDGEKIVELNGSAHPGDELVDLRGGFLAPALGWSPQESISVEESLSFYTEAVAYQGFNEKRFGRIAVGMQADLMILASNPMEVAPHDVAGIQIRAVYKSGVAVIE